MPHRLPENVWLIVGAEEEVHIHIDRGPVSGRHLRLRRSGDTIEVEDLDSTNGTWIRGRQVGRGTLSIDDTVSLGSLELSMTELASAYRGRGDHLTDRRSSRRVQTDEGATRRIELGSRLLVVGRQEDCEVCIPDNRVSSRHARVFRNAGRVVVEDMGSINGTWIRRVGTHEWENYRHAVLEPGDQVRIGKHSEVFEFWHPALEAPPPAEPARIDVNNVEVDVIDHDDGQRLTLLRDITFSAFPGEVIGILGPSGSGKTTLLNVLAGLTAPSRGSVRLNGQDVFEASGETVTGMGGLIGHAPQFDVVHPLLTVEEALRFSAQLRASADWDAGRIESQITSAVDAVMLSEKRSTRIGSPSQKTLSGGQRKRVNIAMELVNDPKVLLLDEPTSGLSSHDTADLMRTLRELADGGRTVVLTIHQPSYSAFIQMDRVLILEEGGHSAYFGPASIQPFDFFGVSDREPEALLERMDRKTNWAEPGPWTQRYRASDLAERELRERPRMPAPPPIATPRARSPLSQLATLVQRSLTMKMRDRFFLMLSFVVPATVAAIFAVVLGVEVEEKSQWSETSAGVEHAFLMVMTIMVCFFGALASALEVVTERPILERERRGGLSLSSYILSKAVSYAVPSVFFPLCALLVLEGLAGEMLEGDILDYWAVLTPAFFASTCAGLLISSAARSEQLVVVVAVFYAIVQVVFSVFVPLHVTYDHEVMVEGIAEEQEARAEWLQVLSAPMTARWTLAGLVASDDLCLPADRDVARGADEVRFENGCARDFYRKRGVHPSDSPDERVDDTYRRKSTLINLLLAGVALMLAGLVLRRTG